MRISIIKFEDERGIVYSVCHSLWRNNSLIMNEFVTPVEMIRHVTSLAEMSLSQGILNESDFTRIVPIKKD